MESTGERFIPEQDEGPIKAEHLSRYLLACQLLNIDDKTVLDIACGTGYGTALLAQSARHAYGVDIAQEAVDYAQAHHQRDNLTYLTGDGCAIPMDDDSVDIVVSFETIEHLENQTTFLSEIKRVLRADGTLIISSPNKQLYSDTLKTENPYHVHELYTEEFVELVRSHFSHAVLFGQTPLWGSLLYPVQLQQPPQKAVADITTEDMTPIASLYNILVASDRPLQLNSQYASFVYNATDNLQDYLQQYYESGYRNCRKTPSFRLGHALLHPFAWIKGIFRF